MFLFDRPTQTPYLSIFGVCCLLLLLFFSNLFLNFVLPSVGKKLKLEAAGVVTCTDHTPLHRISSQMDRVQVVMLQCDSEAIKESRFTWIFELGADLPPKFRYNCNSWGVKRLPTVSNRFHNHLIIYFVSNIPEDWEMKLKQSRYGNWSAHSAKMKDWWTSTKINHWLLRERCWWRN